MSGSHDNKPKHSQARLALEAHFLDRVKAKAKIFQKSDEIELSTNSQHYVAYHQESKDKFLIKQSTTERNTMCNVTEFIMGPVYKRYLYDRTPLIELVDDEESVFHFAIRSKYLHQFETLQRSKAPRSEIKGIEKYFAAMLRGAESDDTKGNVGVMNLGAEDKPDYVYAKIDHGFSAHNYFSDPSQMMRFIERWYESLEEVLGVSAFDFIAFESALSTMLNESDEDFLQLIQNRLHQLKQSGFDPSYCRYEYRVDLASAKYFSTLSAEDLKQKNEYLAEIVNVTTALKNNPTSEALEAQLKDLNAKVGRLIDKAYQALEKHYTENLLTQKAQLQTIRDWLRVLLHVDRPDKNLWLSSGKWLELSNIENFDPYLWAEEHHVTLEGRAPAEVRAHGYVENREEKSTHELIDAVKTGNQEKYKALIQAEIEINSVDENRDTAFIVAVRKGDIEAAKSLMEKGADIHAKNKKGESALQLMLNAEYKELGFIEKLLARGAAPPPKL